MTHYSAPGIKHPLASKIISEISKFTGITYEDIIGKSRKTDIVVARHGSVFILREYIGMSYIAIGEAMNMDHSNAIFCVKQFKNDLKYNRKRLTIIIEFINQLKIEK